VTQGRTRIIACRTVIHEMQHLLPSDMEPLILDSGLHLHPEKMRGTLQAMVDDITASTETIILGFGLCSMGVIGLKASDSTLVIPCLDDCIALFLGSRRAYLKALSQEPGTYFLSRGWIDAGITLVDELRSMEERYGKRRAELVMRRMLQHYRRLAFIDMGYQDQERYRQFSQEAARKLNLSYKEIRGTPELLRRICSGPWDDEFIVAPPGQIIRLEDFGMAPAREQQPIRLFTEQDRVGEAIPR
jgi:hypothetical protein